MSLITVPAPEHTLLVIASVLSSIVLIITTTTSSVHSFIHAFPSLSITSAAALWINFRSGQEFERRIIFNLDATFFRTSTNQFFVLDLQVSKRFLICWTSTDSDLMTSPKRK